MTWSTVTAAPAVDPYLAWTQATGFAGHAAASVPGARVPVLMRLKQPEDLELLEAQGLVSVPGVYRRAPVLHCTGHAARETLSELVAQVDALEFSWPVSAGAVDGSLAAAPAVRDRLVVGVIDRDFAFLNGTFRQATTGLGRSHTRIAHLWDQARRPTGPWARPRDVGYGRELDAPAIDALIARVQAGEREEALYRELAYGLDADGNVPDELHGTHVADTAAGLLDVKPTGGSAKPSVEDAATIAELIFVSLPTLERGDTTGASPAVFWLDAVRYIIERAGPGARVVINMSVGMLGGPHDGSSLISTALDELLGLRSRNLSIVMSAGNGQDERWSASGLLPAGTAAGPGAAASLAWRLMPQDITDSFLELWLRSPGGGTAPVALRVVPPLPEAPSAWCRPGEMVELAASRGLAARLSVRPVGGYGGGAMALLALAPVDGVRAAVTLGRWRLEVRNEGTGPSIWFDAWIQRDEPPLGFGLPLQSSFDEVVGGAVPGVTTISDLACGKGPIVIGAVALRDRSERAYSARRNAPPGRGGFRNIDYAAPADEGVASSGLRAAGMRTGSTFRMSGTSVSAPVVTRQIANRMVAVREYTRADIVAALNALATTASTPSAVPVIPLQ